MKPKKTIVLIVSLIIFSAPVIAGAWGHHHLIHAGDHVFDAKRFADSVKVTAEMIATVQNEIENLKNRILMNTRLILSANPISGAINEAGKLTGDSIISPAKGTATFEKIYSKAQDLFEDGGDYLTKIDETLSSVHRETSSALRGIVQRQQEYEAIRGYILSAETPGLVGEGQRENVVSIMGALETIEQGAATGTGHMNAISEQEAGNTKERLSRKKLENAGRVYGYDPYHPTDYDLANRTSNSENFGFMKFGQ